MNRAAKVLLGLGVLGLAAWGAALMHDPHRALLAWLFAFAFGITIALGALMLVLITDVASATWFLVFRPMATAIAATLPLFGALFAPILAGAPSLYPWAAPLASLPEQRWDEVHQMQHWLTPFPFILRAIAYLAVWSALAFLVRRDLPLAKRRKVGGVGIAAVGFTASWAAFEWIMSLQIGWSSTVFGMIFCVAAFLAGTSATAVAAWLAGRARLAVDFKPDHVHALGRLMLVGVALWAYTQFAQLLIIWIANEPKEVVFYIDRSQGIWASINLVLIFDHFVGPFFALLVREWKRRAALLAIIALWLLAMHLVDMAWLVLPFGGARAPGWVDLAAVTSVVGLAGALALHTASARSALVTHDPALPAALHYESP